MTIEEIEKQIRDSDTLDKRLDSSRNRIAKMCKDGRPPKMTIPVNWDGDDVFISTTIQDARLKIKALETFIQKIYVEEVEVDPATEIEEAYILLGLEFPNGNS